MNGNSTQVTGVNQNRYVATALGYAGLIPFIALALTSWLPAPLSAQSTVMLITYAAIILGFMGAIHWGAALANDSDVGAWHYTASVIPPLIGWMATLLPPIAAIPLLIISFIMLYHYDRLMAAALSFGTWYIPLRRRLTAIVSLSLIISLIALLV